uniref:Uncharacterized protein n=1 Tax=Megaselia scalaris TaxID=36166 RepID=T1GDN2_MEGSC
MLPHQEDKDVTPMVVNTYLCFTKCVFVTAELMSPDGKVIVENAKARSAKITTELISQCEKKG